MPIYVRQYHCINFVPLLLCPLPQLYHPTRWPLILSQLHLEMSPQVFNGIKVWRLCWPRKDLETIAFKPGPGLLADMLGVIVLLEDDFTCIFACKGDSLHYARKNP